MLVFEIAVRCWPYPTAAAEVSCGRMILDRHGVPLAAFVADDEQWRWSLQAEQMSVYLQQAIVAVEDARFSTHQGVDWMAVAAAAWRNVSRNQIHRGASTITMQLHRMRHPRPRSFAWKLEQAVRAAQIERSLTKQQILTEYLNRAPFGGNLVGADAASWRYFGRPCSELSLAQAALLAGLPQNPNRLRPDRNPEQARGRRDHVLDRMLACGFITTAEHANAIAEPLDARWHPLPQSRDYGALPTLVNIAAGFDAPRVTSTLDADIQRQAAEAARQVLQAFEPDGPDAIAVVVLDTASGECLAAVSLARGGGQIDLTRRRRSTGSVLKPFIYAAAFEAGIAAPDGILQDSPSIWNGYAPGNFDRGYRGAIRAAEALAESRNIPALRLLEQVGPTRAAALMGRAGLASLARDPQRYGLSLAIGGAEASPLELAEAYATLARGGMHRATHLVAPPQAQAPARVLLAEACWQTIRALADQNHTRSVSTTAAEAHIAWKTGTSSGHRDAWCAAMSADRTVVAWVGNLDGRGDRRLVGSLVAAPLAVELAAVLDPGFAGWPQPVDQPRVPPELPRQLSHRSLRLISPAADREFILDPGHPPSTQQIRLQAQTGESDRDEQLWWFINGRLHATSRSDEPIWWVPANGAHEIRVIDAHGRSARTRIAVR
jgi:penicillin-binding protein 1C